MEKIIDTVRVFFILTFIPLILLSAGLMTSAIDMWSMPRFLIGLGVVVFIATEFAFVLVTSHVE